MVSITETLKAANAKTAIDLGYMKEVLLTNFSITSGLLSLSKQDIDINDNKDINDLKI